MFLDVFSDNNVTIVTNDKGYIETYIYFVLSFCDCHLSHCHVHHNNLKKTGFFFRRDKKGRVSKYYLHMQNIVFTSKKAGLPFRKTVFYKKGYFIN